MDLEPRVRPPTQLSPAHRLADVEKPLDSESTSRVSQALVIGFLNTACLVHSRSLGAWNYGVRNTSVLT